MNNGIDKLKIVEGVLYDRQDGVPNSEMDDRPSDEIIATEESKRELDTKIAQTKELINQFNEETQQDGQAEEAC